MVNFQHFVVIDGGAKHADYAGRNAWFDWSQVCSQRGRLRPADRSQRTESATRHSLDDDQDVASRDLRRKRLLMLRWMISGPRSLRSPRGRQRLAAGNRGVFDDVDSRTHGFR